MAGFQIRMSEVEQENEADRAGSWACKQIQPRSSLSAANSRDFLVSLLAQVGGPAWSMPLSTLPPRGSHPWRGAWYVAKGKLANTKGFGKEDESEERQKRRNKNINTLESK